MHEFFAFLPLGKPRATNPVRAHLAIPVQTHPAIPVTPPTDRKFQRRFRLPMCTTAFGTCKEFLHVPKRVKNVAILLHVKNPVSRIFPCGNPIFLTTSSLSRPLTNWRLARFFGQRRTRGQRSPDWIRWSNRFPTQRSSFAPRTAILPNRRRRKRLQRHAPHGDQASGRAGRRGRAGRQKKRVGRDRLFVNVPLMEILRNPRAAPSAR